MHLTQLGPYEIKKPLGRGGMGSVYSAVDTQTGQRVAIKALTPHLAMAEGFRERFEAEIDSLKTLRHDGIVRLYGYGEQDGVLFYSMELVDGISLEDELKAGRRFNWREVTNIAIQISHALKHAHDHGIVHRDIKPANILMSGEEQVKLADFGIARLFGNTQLTTAGGVLGTADYMSPEQAEGRPVTARCDQYSLGGVMYALLAGRPPFQAKNLPQMLQLQRFANPEPVRRYAPDTPEQLEQVIAQLLSKEPAERFPNTQVLARHLQAMAMALSRPVAEDFLLDDDSAVDARMRPGGGASSTDATQLELDASISLVMPAESGRPITNDAATLAADDASIAPSTGRAPSSLTTMDRSPPTAVPKTTRFTTLEEEEARERAANQRSWLSVAVQLVALAAVIGCMVLLAIFLSREPSADSLYRTVAERGDDRASLVSVETEINDFLTLYPNDPRAPELERYKEKIELDKLERRFRRLARDSGTADPSLSPVEQLYLKATSVAEHSPEESAAMLQSLVDLYGPEAAEDGEAGESAADIVALAKRRLTVLRSDLEKLHARQLAALRERVEAAERLSQSDAATAAAMFQAIVDLHADDAWAAEVVTRAREQAGKLKSE